MGLPAEDKAALKAANSLPAGVPNPPYQNAEKMTPPAVGRPGYVAQQMQGAGQTGGPEQTDEAALNERIKATYDLLTKLRNEMAALQVRAKNPKLGESIQDIGIAIAMANGQKAIDEATSRLKTMSDTLVDMKRRQNIPPTPQANTLTAKEAALTPNIPKNIAKSSTGTGSSTPVKAADVIAKLKAEEKTGGPNFWDYLQAAAAGWGGQKSAYMTRKDTESQNKTEMDRLIKATEMQSAAQAAANASQFSNQSRLMDKAAEIEKNSKLGVGSIPGLSQAGVAYANKFGVKP